MSTTRKPFTPDEAEARRKMEIPEPVIEAFEEMIVKHLHNGRASFKLHDVAALAAEKLDVAKKTLFDNHWLDVEEVFRDAGWIVKYDQPGYNETYDATFTFRRGRS